MVRLVYNIDSVSRKYVIAFYKFLGEKGISLACKVGLYELLSYSLNKIYDLDTAEYNDLIVKYGTECVSYLSKISGVPKSPLKIGLCSRVWLVCYCKSVFLTMLNPKLVKPREELVNAGIPF